MKKSFISFFICFLILSGCGGSQLSIEEGKQIDEMIEAENDPNYSGNG